MDVHGLDDFQRAFEYAEQHELDPVAVLTAARIDVDDLVCTIDILVNSEVRSRWLATFSGVVENRLAIGEWFMPEAIASHPLLLDHLEVGAQLYFSQQPTNTEAVLAALTAAHKAVLGSWRPIDRYLNANIPTDALLTSGSGQLAVGPATLISQMAQMTAADLHTSTVGTNLPQRWNTRKEAPEQIGNVVVFLSPEWGQPYPREPHHRSYVIASSCSVTPVDSTGP